MTDLKAVLWDFGGVILESPFDAFARYEHQRGLPKGFLRRVNAINPDGNAWARLERGEVSLTEFGALFEQEARAAGGTVIASEVLELLSGDVRPIMVEALKRCRARLKTALLTNNVHGFDREGLQSAPARSDPRSALDQILGLFDVVVESSAVGMRKPDPRFYQLACERLGIEPAEAVFLDDLGINLKPARAMGMTTIKVTDPALALTELAALVGFPLT